MKTAFLFLCASLAIACHAAEVPPPTKPNIVFILADDLSYRDLGCFGQTSFSTPNIDRLASEGRIFTNAYAGAPWCAPSRTALMTGRTANHFAPREVDEKGRGTKFNPTVANMLKDAGYATAAIGKWHMQEGPESWFFDKPTREQQRAAENPAQMPWHRGFDFSRIGYSFGLNPYFPHQIETGDHTEIPLPENLGVDDGYLKARNAAPETYDADGRFVDKNGKNSSQLRYSEDLYRADALKFIEDNRSHPFFLYYATPLMHGPIAVKELGEFKDKPEPWTLRHKIWAAEARELDRSAGLLIDKLKSLGIDKNTLIIFASDNGYAAWGYFNRKAWMDDPVFHNKGPWDRGKFVNANGGLIVPFIAWWPGRVPSGKTDRAISFHDFLPTAGALAGAPLPGPTEGTSFLPLLEGRDKDQPLRKAIGWSTHGNYGIKMQDDADKDDHETGYLPPSVLLDEHWYAIGFAKKPKEKLVVRIYDITSDPGCRTDVSEAHPELCERAQQEFAKLAVADTPKKAAAR